MKASEADPWLDDFTFELTDDEIERESRDPRRYEVFAGSKPLVACWLSLVGVVGGAFGALAVSGALWSWLVQPPLWLAALVLAGVVVRFATIAMFGRGISFLAGWCFFWGFLVGLCALAGAQPGSPYWAYGITGGIGFLIGITHGAYEPPDMQNHDGWFGLGMSLAPAAAVATAWSYRNLLDQPADLATIAACGAAAALIFVAPLMAMLAANWRNEGSLQRLAALYLHNDRYAARAVPLINRALNIQPADPALLGLRGLAHLLAGDAAVAEADWQRHLQLKPGSVEPLVARGAYLLRRGALDDAIAALEEAVARAPKHARAIATLGLAHHRRGNLDRAITLYEQTTKTAPEPLTVTRLAAAHLEAGRHRQALEHSEVAISELDSIHGLSWLVRARAHLALGQLEEAEADFRTAFEAGDEKVAAEAATALEAMGLEVD